MSRSEPQLIIPFAKPSGMTSFTSLWQVKRYCGTKKVGHTGTLDSFADGLLVLLSGKLTKLVPYITDFDKTYLVLFYFGKETDTLDPEGTVIDEKPLPCEADFRAALARLTGTIEQIPPVYSAIKQDGRRLSDRIRHGEAVSIPSRTVTIYDICIQELFFAEDTAINNSDRLISGAVLRVHCSKGTYIRSLVRDIARFCNSAAYVYALRRVTVGPFSLKQAVGADMLPPFNAAAARRCITTRENAGIEKISAAEFERAALSFTAGLAAAMKFFPVSLRDEYYSAFITGKPIHRQWFLEYQSDSPDGIIAVFLNQRCVGLVKKSAGKFMYEAVFGVSDTNG